MHYHPPANLLEKKIILVTGAGEGIGREAALTYARYGARLIRLGRTYSKLVVVKQQIEQAGGALAEVIPLDLLQASPSDCQTLAEQLARQVTHLDGVLHNAGMLGEIAPMAQQSPATWQQVMQINVNAAFMLTQALLPLLLQSGQGSLVFTSSGVGRQGRAGWGAYAVSKFATEGMMQVFAAEYPPQQLRVNCINPGGTRTAMRAAAFPDEDPATLKTPADIMPLYLYLMGDDSREQTGITFDAQPGRKPDHTLPREPS